MGKRRRVQVQLRRGAARARLRLASDVIVLPRAVPTAYPIASNNRSGSAGIIISWSSAGTQHWGMVTAAHVFDPANPPTLVLGTNVLGNVIFRSRPGDAVDVGVFELSAGDAEQLSPGVTTLPIGFQITPQPFAALLDDQQLRFKTWLCLAPQSDINFNVDLLISGPTNIIATLPGLNNLIQGRARRGSQASPFRRGRSGSPCCEIPDQTPGGILIGADDAGFSTGYFQSLALSLDFLSGHMAADPAIAAANLRLVALL